MNDLHAIIDAMNAGAFVTISKPRFTPATWAIVNGSIITKTAFLGENFYIRYDVNKKSLIKKFNRFLRDGFSFTIEPARVVELLPGWTIGKKPAEVVA